jgi:hypothetical protein
MTPKNFVSLLLLCSLTTSAMATTMSIVVKSNPKYCLDLFGQMTQDGTPIDLWECAPGLQGQQWFFDAGSWKIRSAVNSSKCVDAGTGNVSIGTKLTLNDCEKTQSLFGWDIATNAIYSSPQKGALTPGSKCIQIANVSEGADVSIAACKAKEENQQFAAVVGPPPAPPPAPWWNGTFTFHLGTNTSKCLSIPTSFHRTTPVSNGDPVVVRDCPSGGVPGPYYQSWVFTQGSYKIQSADDPMKCIDAADMKRGTPLMMWDCNGFPQQQWGYKEAKDKASGSVYLTQAPSQTVACMQADGQDRASVGDCVQWQLMRITDTQATVII